MGKGLQINENSVGVHFVFCAGTAALVFLDLVANMIIQTACESKDVKLPNEVLPLHKDFVLHLYVSFAERKEGIGLDILEAMDAITKKLGKDNFKLNVRLSKPDG